MEAKMQVHHNRERSMTEYELEAVGKAVERTLTLAAPGISQITRYAIVNRTLLRLRHQFNLPGKLIADGEADIT
jgi:hypothetical protein